MSALTERVEAVQQWVAHADSDLVAARHLLLLGADCPLKVVCFHAQQCVEKYLKARLTAVGKHSAKTHDIVALRLDLPHSDPFPLSVTEQETLSDYAVVTRYPGETGPLDRADAEAAVDCAVRVRDAVRPLLPLEALR